MKLAARLAAVLLAAGALAPTAAQAGVNVGIHIDLPAAPPLVVVQPGVRVVEDCDEEVYFASGYYWVRRDHGWYRSRRPRATFVFVEPRVVPVAVARMPPGRYVRYRGERHGPDHGRRHDHDDHAHWGDHGHDHGGHGHGKHRGKGHGKHGRHHD
jgi:hypothetical protein